MVSCQRYARLSCTAQMPPGQTASKEAIELAASLAAHFSKGSASSRVAVDYTDRKQVKKPSGSKPGFVIYFQQTTLYVSPDPERLKPYLENKKTKTGRERTQSN